MQTQKLAFIQLISKVLLIVAIADFVFRLIAAFAPDHLEFHAFFPGMLLILAYIPLRYHYSTEKSKMS